MNQQYFTSVIIWLLSTVSLCCAPALHATAIQGSNPAIIAVSTAAFIPASSSTAAQSSTVAASTSQKIMPKPLDKPSLIEQALDQQKHRNTQQLHRNELDLLHNIPLASSPTQRFFAAQHQQFSRWVQAVFSNSGS